MKRDKLLELALCGLVGGGASATMVELIKLGFKSEDIFAVSGAAIGSAATVLGAVWASDRSENKQRRREREVLSLHLSALLKLTDDAIASCPNGRAWTEKWKADLAALATASLDDRAVIAEAIAHAKTLDFQQRAKLVHAGVTVGRFRDYYEEVFSESYEDHPLDERSWGSMMVSMRTPVAEALRALAAL